MKLNKLLIWCVLVVGLASLVVAKPTTTITNNNNGLQIESGHNEIIKYDNSTEIYFHVYNSTNDFLNSSQVNCYFHLYNESNGQHLIDHALMVNHSYREFEYKINTSLLTFKGTYTYIVTCEGVGSQTEKGFLKSYFILTALGESLTWESFILGAVYILLPLLFSFLILQWALALGEDHVPLKIGMSLLSQVNILFSLWIATQTVIKFVLWDEMQDTLTIGLWIYGLLFFVLFSYWVIYLIKKSFETMHKAKVEKLNY